MRRINFRKIAPAGGGWRAGRLWQISKRGAPRARQAASRANGLNELNAQLPYNGSTNMRFTSLKQTPAPAPAPVTYPPALGRAPLFFGSSECWTLGFRYPTRVQQRWVARIPRAGFIAWEFFQDSGTIAGILLHGQIHVFNIFNADFRPQYGWFRMSGVTHQQSGDIPQKRQTLPNFQSPIKTQRVVEST